MTSRAKIEKRLKIAAIISGIVLAIVWAVYGAYIVPMGRSGLYYWGKVLAPWMVSLGCVVVMVSVGAALISNKLVALRTVALAGGMTIAGFYWWWTGTRATQETLEHNTLEAFLAAIFLAVVTCWRRRKDWLHLSLRAIVPLVTVQVVFPWMQLFPYIPPWVTAAGIVVCLSAGFGAAGARPQFDE